MHDTRKWGAALFALVVLAWLPALWGEFVWDDRFNLVVGDRLHHWSALVEAFRHNAMWSADRAQPAIGTYRPLSLATFVVDYQLWGHNPLGFHLTNIVLHALAALVLFRFAARWTASVGAAFALALVWALHPMAVEAVAWINGRSEVLALLFGASALWTVSAPVLGAARLTGAAALLLLAMLGKETGAVFVPVAVLLAGEATGRAEPGRPLWRRVHWPMAGAAAVAVLVYAGMRGAALEGGVVAGVGDGATALRALPAVWIRALQTALLPIDRSLAHLHRWLRDLPAAAVAAYAAASAALAALGAWSWWRGRRVAAIGLLWWLGSLTPIAAIAIKDWPGLNRWLYAGLPGLLLAIWTSLPELTRRARITACAVVLVPLAFQLERAIPVWHDDGHLFGTMIEESPDDTLGYTGLGAWLVREGRYADAQKILEAGVGVGEVRAEHYLFLGMAKAELGACADAVRVVRDHVAAAEVEPWFLLSAAGCFSEAGDTAKARQLDEACAERHPACAEALAKLPPR